MESRLINEELDDIARRAEAVLNSMRDFVHKVDRVSYSELRAIGDYIGKTREEITALAPVAIAQRRIPQAGAELDALVRDSGDATEVIMTAAEELMSCPATTVEAYADYVNEKAMVILEACGFHDLAGQRVSKVTEVLRVIEDRAQRFASQLGVSDAPEAETDKERRSREQMLNGPTIRHEENSQSSIDDLFAQVSVDD